MIKLPLAHVTKYDLQSRKEALIWKLLEMHTLKPHPRPTESKAEQNLQDIHMLIKVVRNKDPLSTLHQSLCVGGWGWRIRRKSGREEQNEGRKVKEEEGVKEAVGMKEQTVN